MPGVYAPYASAESGASDGLCVPAARPAPLFELLGHTGIAFLGLCQPRRAALHLDLILYFTLPCVNLTSVRPRRAQESLMLPGLGSDWEIDPANIAILRRPDGSEWELGSGASGRVRRPPRLHTDAGPVSGARKGTIQALPCVDKVVPPSA